eukprot:SAG11_NODE_14182_length_622_cov_0.917782_1_plen_112_part_00
MQAWLDAHPHLILFVLLPPLLFEDSVSIDYHTFRKSLWSSMLLAGPGVLMSTCFTGLFSSQLFYQVCKAIATSLRSVGIALDAAHMHAHRESLSKPLHRRKAVAAMLDRRR